MTDEFCPKCDEIVTPKWHKSCDLKEDIAHSNKEHLHYYCKCGYDFIKPVNDEPKIVEY